MTLKDLANKFTNSLKAMYEEDEAQAIFLIALAHVTKYNRGAYLLKKEETIAAENLSKLEVILSMLVTGKPIQYITGETTFYGLPFKVNPSVLIPRPETEELVDWILEVCKSNSDSARENILDIGTGSGCIAISLKKNLATAKVYGLDIAADSLITAKENTVLNDVEVEFIQADILDNQNSNIPTPFSIIVSNPPYIKEDEKPAMHHNVLANEPHRALFVSNDKPLVFYEAIADFALKNLAKNGLLFLEINEYLGQQTVDLLNYKGFANIELRKDMQGKDRMIKANL
jgi:release factor glutamine methyltransferase